MCIILAMIGGYGGICEAITKQLQNKLQDRKLREVYGELPEGMLHFLNNNIINYCLHENKTGIKQGYPVRVVNSWLAQEVIKVREEDKGKIRRFDKLENTKKHMNNRGLGIERYMEQRRCPYDKIFIYTDEKSDVKAFFEFIKDDMEVIDRGSNTFECILKGYTKGTAIDWVLEHFGMTRDQSYAFGDSSNDLAMFRHAGHAIAMGAHDQVLEPYTEFITKTVEEDGIAYAMKKYGLID